jgi:hypothetical protein
VTIIYLVAISYVWSRGSIFRSLRTRGPALWRQLADCPLCSGVWIGLLGQLAFRLWPGPLTILGRGSLVGAAAFALYGAIRRL